MQQQININYFESYEQQMSYFTNITNINLLPMTKGKSEFFAQLGKWFRDYNTNDESFPVSYILPNPAQGMSFPTALDVLTAALSMNENIDNVEEQAVTLLLKFGLEANKATQPIVSLSGGELLLLSYAKAEAMLPTVTSIVACSPVYWLNKTRYKYWNNLVTKYQKSGKGISIALLNGESFPNTTTEKNIICKQNEDVLSLRWKLIIKSPKVVFQEIRFPSYHPESSIQFICEFPELELASPTLVTGDNGIGKSILAKLLAGVLDPIEGSIFSLSENGKGSARLILQDSIDQLFGMSIDSHIDWIFRFDSAKSKSARNIYTDMEQTLRKQLNKSHFDSLMALGKADQRTTLLQAKLCLVAERIASLPPLLLLDEPGWGLSRIVSRCFMWEICKVAHKNGIAVAIISHQPIWWEGLINSHIELKRNESDTVQINISEEYL